MGKNSLKKVLLRKIPVQLATEATISQARRHEKASYYIKAAVRMINHKRILVLQLYSRKDLVLGIKEPRIRTFLTKTDYISQCYEEGTVKWRTGRLDSLLAYDYYNKEEPVLCDTASERAVNTYLSYTEDERIKRSGYAKIREAQNMILEQRLQKKHAMIEKRIDRKMQEVKPLPKDFDDWIDAVAMAHSRYIYYRYSRKKYMDGYCTHCHQEVKVHKVRHRAKGHCPKCGVKVIFLAEGKAKHIFDHGQVAYFQKTPKGFLVRYFSVSKSYYGDYRNPKISTKELMREFYEDSLVLGYEYRQFKQTGKIRWCQDWMKYSFLDVAVYTKNLHAVLKNTRYQYCALKEFASRWDGAAVNPYGYLKRYQSMPEIEYFVKAGLYAMAYELTSYSNYAYRVQRNKKSLHEMLGVSKQNFRFIQACDMSFYQLDIYNKLCKQGVNLSIGEFKRFYDTYRKNMDVIFALLQYTSLHKAERYCNGFIDRQYDLLTIMGIWKDYICFCRELGYDLKNSFVLFPKDLLVAHKLAYQDVLNRREQERRKKIQQEERRAKRLLKKYRNLYAWKDNRFAVVVPKDLLEIKEEGHTLHHCVATYTSRVADGTSIILFVRDLQSPDKPFYTMELQKNKIIQCRGYSNHVMTSEVQEFVKRYESRVLKKIREKNAA